jgi:gluconate 5-dehydrogenase
MFRRRPWPPDGPLGLAGGEDTSCGSGRPFCFGRGGQSGGQLIPSIGESVQTQSWLQLDGSRVLVAGVGGLGAACARGFADQGCRVAVADRMLDRSEDLAAELDPAGERVVALEADLSEPGQAQRAVADVVGRWGGIDVLFHAVGINIRRPVVEYSPEDWTRTLEVNLSTAFWLGQAAGEEMCRQGKGRIIFVSSVSGLLAHKHHAPYAASKGAINQMMRVMAVEWAPLGVTVNAVAPGYVETALTREHLDRDGNRNRLESMVPAGRLGTPDEVVGPVLFLASPHAGFVTGHVMYIDGGRTLV